MWAGTRRRLSGLSRASGPTRNNTVMQERAGTGHRLSELSRASGPGGKEGCGYIWHMGDGLDR